jgi:hypothetical protein
MHANEPDSSGSSGLFFAGLINERRKVSLVSTSIKTIAKKEKGRDEEGGALLAGQNRTRARRERDGVSDDDSDQKEKIWCT